VQPNNTMSHRTVEGEPLQADLLRLVRCTRALIEQQRASGVRWIRGRGTAAIGLGGRDRGFEAGQANAPQSGSGNDADITAPPRADDRAFGGTKAVPTSPLPSGEEVQSDRQSHSAGAVVMPVRAATPASGDLFADPGLQGAASLDALRAHIGDCTRCKLAGGRTNIVFGVGNPHAELMFVGEGPGYDEDLQGEPFVGRAGQLLTEIITKGMKLQRADVYIANIVKCRPPNNRNPEPDEIAHCQPFVFRQIELVKPRVIVALGSVAAQALLGVRTPIGRLRGVWHEFRGIKVMPTFHPAYLLRNPAEKKVVWADIKQVMRELGLQI
jgi:uracil-DNA glycosylase